MITRIGRFALAFAVAGSTLCADTSVGQVGYVYLQSLEWLVTESDIVVRGVVVDVSREGVQQGWVWSTVTLEVRETFKGMDAKRLKFAIQAIKSNRAIEQWKNSKRELLCFLHRKDGLLARHGTDLCAPGLQWTVVPLGPPEEESRRPPIFNLDLKLLDKSKDILEAAREAVAKQGKRKQVRSHSLDLTGTIEGRMPYRGDGVAMTVPVDHRLEALASRLIVSPGDFLPQPEEDPAGSPQERRLHEAWLKSSKNKLRSEGAKALRYFRSEKNTSLLKPLLDDDAYVHSTTEAGKRELIYHVREAAYQTLRGWGVEVRKPVLREDLPPVEEPKSCPKRRRPTKNGVASHGEVHALSIVPESMVLATSQKVRPIECPRPFDRPLRQHGLPREYDRRAGISFADRCSLRPTTPDTIRRGKP